MEMCDCHMDTGINVIGRLERYLWVHDIFKVILNFSTSSVDKYVEDYKLSLRSEHCLPHHCRGLCHFHPEIMYTIVLSVFLAYRHVLAAPNQVHPATSHRVLSD